jgi:hypothetical protein
MRKEDLGVLINNYHSPFLQKNRIILIIPMSCAIILFQMSPMMCDTYMLQSTDEHAACWNNDFYLQLSYALERLSYLRRGHTKTSLFFL